MTERTKLGLTTLGASLLLGVLGDGLLRAGPVGLNWFLWVAAIVAGLALLARRAGPLPPLSRRLLLLPVLCGAAFMWRDSETLAVLTVLALGSTLVLAALAGRGVDLRRSSLLDYGLGAATVGVFTAGGLLPLLFTDIEWQTLPRGRFADKSAAALRGLLIALPLLLIFGGLFMAADAVFANLATGWISFDLDQIMGHVVLTGFLTWIVAGYLRTALAVNPPDLSGQQKPAWLSVGAIEAGVVLGLLNVLFLAFVLVQFRYFFGGAALVESATGLTYAEYARNGFFELVGVSALVLPVLLFGHWLLPTEGAASQRLFRWMAGALVAQLFVIMASALQRMLLYVGEFGLTELRLYSTAFMAWLAILFVWFVLTVLRGRRERFTWGAVLSAMAVLAGLYLVSPDALIARVNVARLHAGQTFDAGYAASLGADAVPILVQALPDVPAEDRSYMMGELRSRWLDSASPSDWRSWNLARSRARAAVSTLDQAASVDFGFSAP